MGFDLAKDFINFGYRNLISYTAPMKKLYLPILAILFSCTFSYSQYVVNYQLMESFTRTALVQHLQNQGIPTLFIPINNGLDIYKITYNTVSYDSTPTTATGTLFVPTELTCAAPLAAYCHGTILKKTDAPSNRVGEYIIGLVFSGDGYVVTMPDYLGLGGGSGLHPYIHAQSEATATIDLMRAARELLPQLGVSLNDQVFITGYSQGGHSAMATHKMIEEHLPGEFKVSMSSPLSGPYDVSGVQAEVITRDSSYGSPGYLPFVVFSYNMVYNLYNDYSQIFVSPYDTLLPPLFDGSVGLGTIDALIPDTPNLILQPALLNDFKNDPNHPIRQVLRLNDLYRWAPQAPVRMYYCEADELVTYRNALVALDSLTAYGGVDVDAASSGPILSHSGCAMYALLAASYNFGTLRKDRPQYSLNVNPASQGSAADGSATISGQNGYPPYTYTWSTGANGASVNDLPYGNHYVVAADSFGCGDTIFFSIGAVGTEYFSLSEIQIFPNPSQGTLVIKNPQHVQARMSVMNPEGKTVFAREILSTQEQWDLSFLASGVYFIRLSGTEQTVVKKWVKE